jgi:hypothetical protein
MAIPRMPTRDELKELALVLLEMHCPRYPFPTADDISHAVRRVLGATIAVFDQYSTGNKRMVILWSDDPTTPRLYSWSNGSLTPVSDDGAPALSEQAATR